VPSDYNLRRKTSKKKKGNSLKWAYQSDGLYLCFKK
jgi:hypothetical protein